MDKWKLALAKKTGGGGRVGMGVCGGGGGWE